MSRVTVLVTEVAPDGVVTLNIVYSGGAHVRKLREGESLVVEARPTPPPQLEVKIGRAHV